MTLEDRRLRKHHEPAGKASHMYSRIPQKKCGGAGGLIDESVTEAEMRQDDVVERTQPTANTTA